MGFPNAWRSQKDDIRMGFEERQLRQLPQKPLRDRWLKGKIERFQRFAHGESSDLLAIVRSSGFASLDFQGQHSAQKRLVRQRVEPGLLKQVGEFFLHIFEMQKLEQVIHWAASNPKS